MLLGASRCLFGPRSTKNEAQAKNEAGTEKPPLQWSHVAEIDIHGAQSKCRIGGEQLGVAGPCNPEVPATRERSALSARSQA